MLGYVAGCLAWGAVKAHLLGVHRAKGSHMFSGLGAPELAEELEFRLGVEQGAKHLLGLSAPVARLGQAALFGLVHPGHELDAALGGFVYSKAYEKHGLLGSFAAHLAHNVGCWLGAKS